MNLSSVFCGGFRARRKGVLLVILAVGVPPGSRNPDPISDQKFHFPKQFSNLASYIHIRFLSS